VADPANTQTITQKRIWNQVRTGSSIYTMNRSAFASAGKRLASGSTVNWNQRSDRVLAATQPALIPTHGNSLRSTLTSGRPGAGSPGGAGVDVKHDSYARYLNRKKAGNMQTQNNAEIALMGNKTNAIGFMRCCT
jgi:hypothetical protein